jgi:hypothetical protein
MCLLWCPCLEECRQQALSAAEQQPGVLGGLGLAERLAIRQARAEARLERARAVSRNSERRRTALGLNAQYQRDRYKQDPEPRRALNNAWYARNAEAVKARARERYAAAKAAG